MLFIISSSSKFKEKHYPSARPPKETISLFNFFVYIIIRFLQGGNLVFRNVPCVQIVAVAEVEEDDICGLVRFRLISGSIKWDFKWLVIQKDFFCRKLDINSRLFVSYAHVSSDPLILGNPGFFFSHFTLLHWEQRRKQKSASMSAPLLQLHCNSATVEAN